MRRIATILAAVAGLALAAAGCGDSEPGLVPVRGKVTLGGGPWPAEGKINFTPAGGGEKVRPGSGSFAADGAFRVTSFTENDGLYPGTYNAAVDCWEEAPAIGMDGRPTPGKSPVPKKYQNPTTSGLSITVKPDDREAVAEFDIPADTKARR